MANVLRYDPFGELFDDFFKGFLVRPVVNEPAVAGRLKVDVSEQNGTFKVLAEIPGAEKEDIRVAIDGDQISISREIKQFPAVLAPGRVRTAAGGNPHLLIRERKTLHVDFRPAGLVGLVRDSRRDQGQRRLSAACVATDSSQFPQLIQRRGTGQRSSSS